MNFPPEDGDRVEARFVPREKTQGRNGGRISSRISRMSRRMNWLNSSMMRRMNWLNGSMRSRMNRRTISRMIDRMEKMMNGRIISRRMNGRMSDCVVIARG